MSTAYTGHKPNLSFWSIWNMCFGFFGIQFGWSLQLGNMSAIYEFLGASPDEIPGLWLAAPMTGLVIQPIVGYLSDRTWNPRWGRRRPFFLVGAIISSLMLFALPNSPALWIAAGSLWILDSSINITMEPFRAFVADNLNKDQSAKGFAMQSMFIGLASFIAGFLPMWLVNIFGVTREKINGTVPQNILYSFYIGGVVFLCAVLYTVFKAKEYPPSDPHWKLHKKENNTSFFAELYDALKNMPPMMKKMAVVNFLTWPGLFLMWFYYSTGVAVQIFGGDPTTNSEAYTKGLELANASSAILNLVTFFFALSIPFWVKNMGKKWTHVFALTLGGIGLISVFYVKNSNFLYLSMGLVGIAWASILSMPYALLASSLPEKRMGIYMGIFNFFIVLPEIIASLTFGRIMDSFLHNNRLLAVQVGGCLLLLAALVCSLIVKDTDKK